MNRGAVFVRSLPRSRLLKQFRRNGTSGMGFRGTAVLRLDRRRRDDCKFYLSFLTVFGEWYDGQSGLEPHSCPFPVTNWI